MIILKLDELLKKHNMTQKELSLKTNIRAATVSSLVNNTWKTISQTLIDRICETFKCTPGDFIVYIADPSELIPEKTDLTRAREIYYEHLGVKPENIEHINLTVAEYNMLQKILKNAKTILEHREDDMKKAVNLEWLLNRVTALTLVSDIPNKSSCKPLWLSVWLSNDYYLDDFTQVLYYIVKEHEREVIYDFSEKNEDSIFEGLYIKFIEKTDDDTIKKIEALVNENKA